MQDEFRAQGVATLAVSADEAESSARYKKRTKLSYPLLSDPELEAVSAWGLAMDGADIAVPTVYVIDRKGRITWRRQSETQFDRPAIRTMREQVALEHGHPAGL